MESAFLCTLTLGLKLSTCTQWGSNWTGRKPANTNLARKQIVRHGKGKSGRTEVTPGWSHSAHIHKHKRTLLLTLSIKVPQEPWGLLWSQLPCHLAEPWSLFIGTSQSSRLECYAFNFHPSRSVSIFCHHCFRSQCHLSKGRLRTSLTSHQFIKTHNSKLTAAAIKG